MSRKKSNPFVTFILWLILLALPLVCWFVMECVFIYQADPNTPNLTDKALENMKARIGGTFPDLVDAEEEDPHNAKNHDGEGGEGDLPPDELRRRAVLAKAAANEMRQLAIEATAEDWAPDHWALAEDQYEAGRRFARLQDYRPALDSYLSAHKLYGVAEAQALNVAKLHRCRAQFQQAWAEADNALISLYSGDLGQQLLEHVSQAREAEGKDEVTAATNHYLEALALLPQAIQAAHAGHEASLFDDHLESIRSAIQSRNPGTSHALIEKALAMPGVRYADLLHLASTLEQPPEIDLPLATDASSPTLTLRWIPPGRFIRGSRRTPQEQPVRQVEIERGFWIGTTEISEAQYAALPPPDTRPQPAPGNTARLPACKLTWGEASAWCQRLGEQLSVNVRLPLETEWEYACRAGSTTPYHFGLGQHLHEFGNYCDASCIQNDRDPTHRDGFPQRAPIASFQPNPWGLYDMHGNVYEWCQDRYAPSYSEDPAPDAQHRVVRGGCWKFGPDACRSTARHRYSPTFSSAFIGFRVVVQPER